VRTSRESKRLARLVDELLDPTRNEFRVEQLLRKWFARVGKSVRVFAIRRIDRRNGLLEPVDVFEIRHVERLSTGRERVDLKPDVSTMAHVPMSALARPTGALPRAVTAEELSMIDALLFQVPTSALGATLDHRQHWHASWYIGGELRIAQGRSRPIRAAVAIPPRRRYAEISEFLYDLRHPNPAYLRERPLPLLERDPLRFWKGLSALLAALLAATLWFLLWMVVRP
jgi:hypothetical protein